MNFSEQDSENDYIYHSELFTLTKRMAKGEPLKLSFTVPVFEPHPPQYYIRAVSDSWLQAEAFFTISFSNLALPEVLYLSLFSVSLFCLFVYVFVFVFGFVFCFCFLFLLQLIQIHSNPINCRWRIAPTLKVCLI